MSAPIEVDAVAKRFKVLENRPLTVQELVVGRLSGRWKPLKTFWALKDISFVVEKGCSLGVIGHNGAGKSTLLRLICGLGRPTSGRIRRRGHVRGLLDLGKGFHPNMTGRENLVTGGILNGLTRRQIEARQADIIEFAELEDVIDQPVRTYSQGMYLRLAFATAVDLDPDVLVIDEVLAVGDQRFRAKCMDRLNDLRRSGRTMLITSHDSDQIRNLCDEVIVLEEGHLVTRAEPDHAIRCQLELLQQRSERRAARLGALGREPLTSPQGDNRFKIGSGEAALRVEAIRGDTAGSAETVRTGGTLDILLAYELTEEVSDAALLFGIYTDRDVKCFETYLYSLKETVGPLRERGSIRCRIPNLPLLPGRYQVSAGLFPPDCSYAYSYHWRMHDLVVLAEDGLPTDPSGIVSLKPLWSAEETAPAPVTEGEEK